MTQSRANSEKRQNSRQGRSKNVATVALLASLALILSYVEAIIPYTPGIPGIKLGIANLVALIALYRLGAKYAVMVNAIRVIVAGLLFTGLFGMLYSLAGAAVSLIGMTLLKKTNIFSISGVSMLGGILHNMGQLIVASFLIDDARIFYYLPILMISGTIAGVAIGVAAELVMRRAKFL